MDEMDEMDLSDYDGDFDARKSSSSRMITLFRKRKFDFTHVGSGGNTTITIRKSLRLSPFYHYWLGLRIHNLVMPHSGAKIELRWYPTLPSAEDPQEFSDAIVSALTLYAGYGETAPMLKTATTTSLAPAMKVTMYAVQGTGTGALYAELSAVLVVRQA
jgi:hypothetical protein